MKILLDDTGFIEDEKGETLIKCIAQPYTFHNIVMDILTESQFTRYVENETHRTFILSKKKVEILLKYMKNSPIFGI